MNEHIRRAAIIKTTIRDFGNGQVTGRIRKTANGYYERAECGTVERAEFEAYLYPERVRGQFIPDIR